MTVWSRSRRWLLIKLAICTAPRRTGLVRAAFTTSAAAQAPKDYPPVASVKLVTLNEQVLGQFGGALLMLFAAVALLLVIGCANVSILLLARGTARMHELALRSSVLKKRAGRSVAQE